MNKLRILALLVPLALQAQQFNSKDAVSRTYEMKTYDDVRADAIRELVQDVMGSRVLVNWLPALHTIVLRGPAADIDSAVALLVKYDVPARQVAFTAYVVHAMKSKPLAYVNEGGRALARATEPPNNPMPAAIEPALAELKQTLGYQYFDLLDVNTTRTSSHAQYESSLNYGQTYSIGYAGVTVSADGKVVTVPRFSIRLTSQGRAARGGAQNPPATSSVLENEIVIHGDERLVLGKLSLGPGAADIFVILTAKPL